MKKIKKVLSLILTGGIILSSIVSICLNVNAENNDNNYTINYQTLNKIAVGSKNTGYITGGKTYVSYGNETIGVNEGGGTNYYEPHYINLPYGQHAIDVEKGNFHTLILTEEGKVFSLGDNEYGQLGNGTCEDSEVFCDLSEYFNNEKVVQISADGYHSLALTENGNLYGWGYNKYGQVGTTSGEITNIPTLTHTFNKKIKIIEAGGYSSFVLTEDGEVYGWGFNGYGNLGNNDTTRRYTPELVQINEPINMISAGKQHAMALTENGNIYMWGKNDFHQIDNSDAEYYTLPVQILTLDTCGLTSIVANENSSCMVTYYDIYVWGDNSSFNNSSPSITLYSRYFSDLYSDASKIEVALGSNHTAFLAIDHKIYTCGKSLNGQCATGEKTEYSEFQEVTDKFLISNQRIYEKDNQVLRISQSETSDNLYNVASSLDFSDVEMSFYNNDKERITIDKKGNIDWFKDNITTDVCAVWKENEFLINSDFENPKYKNYIINYKIATYNDEVITAGRNHTMYLKFDEKLIGWGSNKYGQLGIARTSTKQVPISIYLADNEKIISVKCGYNHTVILTKSGKVYTFDLNDYGQLGDGTYTDKYSPVLINCFDSPVVRIEASARQTFAITENGSVYAWGANSYGQLGDGTLDTQNSPVNITNIFENEIVENIISGYYSTYAITESGKVYSWGFGSKGNLGDGTKTGKTTPVEITDNFNGEKVYKIDAGAQHAIALTYSGNAYVWGYNDKNQLGLSDNIITLPVKINTEKISDVFADESNIGYLNEDGKITMLGDNSYNQLGTGISNLLKLTFGQKHSALIGLDGNIYVCGENNYRQLGITDADNISEYVNITDKVDKDQSTGKTECELVVSNLIGNKFNVYITVNNVTNIKNKIFKITYDLYSLKLDDACIMTLKKETSAQKIPNSFINIISVTNGEICFKYELDTTKKVCGWINGMTFISNKNSAKEIKLELTEEEITE